jgi:hypothetical protein
MRKNRFQSLPFELQPAALHRGGRGGGGRGAGAGADAAGAAGAAGAGGASGAAGAGGASGAAGTAGAAAAAAAAAGLSRLQTFARCSGRKRTREGGAGAAAAQQAEAPPAADAADAEGCPWTGTVSGLDAHAKVCGFVEVTCDLKCGGSCGVLALQRRHVKGHAAVCAHRLVACPDCAHIMTFRVLNGVHGDSCPNKKIGCPSDGCGETTFRKDMYDHVQRCPKALIPCQHLHQGCAAMPRREDMRKHFAEAQIEHATLVASDLADLRWENKELKELKQDYDALRTDRDALQRQITALTERTQEILAAPKAFICWEIEDWAATLAALQQTRDPLYSSVVQVGVHRVRLCLALNPPGNISHGQYIAFGFDFGVVSEDDSDDLEVYPIDLTGSSMSLRHPSGEARDNHTENLRIDHVTHPHEFENAGHDKLFKVNSIARHGFIYESGSISV